MEKKRLIEVTLLGVSDIAIGIFGFLPNFIMGIWSLLPGREVANFDYTMGFVTVYHFLPASFPFLLIILGIMILKMKPISRKLSLFALPFVAVGIFFGLDLSLLLIAHYTNIEHTNVLTPTNPREITAFLITLILLICHILIFNRSEVKEQFKISGEFREHKKINIKKLIVREGLVIAVFAVLFYLNPILRDLIVMLCYPTYLIIRFIIWTIRKLKES